MAAGRVMGVRDEAEVEASDGSKLSCGGWKGRDKLIVGDGGTTEDDEPAVSTLILSSTTAGCAVSEVGSVSAAVVVRLTDVTTLVLKRPRFCLPCAVIQAQ